MNKKKILIAAGVGATAGIVWYIIGKKRKQASAALVSYNKSVLILVNHDVVIYNFRLELVERLLSEGYEVHISSPIGEHTEDLKALGAHFHPIMIDRHGMNPVAELSILFEYRRLMKEFHPLIVFTYTVKPNIYGGIVARHLHIPFVANVTGLGTTVNGGGLKKKLVLSLYKFGLKGVQRVFFQNEENKDFMIGRGVIDAPHSVLPGSGVNLERNPYEPYPEETAKLIFTTIGRIMKDKGTDELIEAAREIKKHHPNIIFRLIGFFDDDYELKIREAEQEGVITYIEQQRNIHPWMAESHAIIHPSYHEGMSNVLLEAASTGRPIMASNIPGCKEAFEEGVSGMGFKQQDKQSLIDTIERFIALPYEQKAEMGKNGRKLMEAKFSREIVIEKYMREIERL